MKDRLCHTVEKGIPCAQGDACQYSHDALEFLANKPADLGNSCYQFETFGYCPNGLMCRFGDCHIDRATGKNISRPEELGGVVDRINMNVLKKEVQYQLRKKIYNFKAQAVAVAVAPASAVASATSSIKSSDITSAPSENQMIATVEECDQRQKGNLEIGSDAADIVSNS